MDKLRGTLELQFKELCVHYNEMPIPFSGNAPGQKQLLKWSLSMLVLRPLSRAEKLAEL